MMRLKQTEEEILKALWRCGVATRRQLEHYFGLYGNRLRLLDSASYISIHLDEVRLGGIGIDFCENDLLMKDRYKTTYRQTNHDLMLTQAYLSLTYTTRETWKTERQIHREFESDPRFMTFYEEIVKSGQLFCAIPDGAFFNKMVRGFVAIEIITKSYSQDRILQKRRLAELMFSGIHVISI